ncbi:MAG: aminopeptidase P family protein [Dehalococcoidia bacterium]|nr:aminopeptidase P family protein [Dehalococcoidia bacterium]
MRYLKRLEKLRSTLAEKNIPALLVSQPENRAYLSGFLGSSGYLLITATTQILATDFRYIEQAKEQAPSYVLLECKGKLDRWLVECLIELKQTELFFETDALTYDDYSQIKTLFEPQELTLKPINGLVENLRMIKEIEEIALIEKAVSISDNAIEHAAEIIRTGMSEIELAWEIEKYMRENGSQPIPFAVIVAAGKNSALPHHRPSSYRIKEQEPIIIDIGANWQGYSSDITRTFCLGKRDEKFNQIYAVVLQAQAAAIEKVRHGMSGTEADNIARTVIETAGYGSQFGHGLGHGIGLAIHEGPRLGISAQNQLCDGMVFTIEPGIYLPDWGGIRIEDSVVMESGKIRTLSTAKK